MAPFFQYSSNFLQIFEVAVPSPPGLQQEHPQHQVLTPIVRHTSSKLHILSADAPAAEYKSHVQVPHRPIQYFPLKDASAESYSVVHRQNFLNICSGI